METVDLVALGFQLCFPYKRTAPILRQRVSFHLQKFLSFLWRDSELVEGREGTIPTLKTFYKGQDNLRPDGARKGANVFSAQRARTSSDPPVSVVLGHPQRKRSGFLRNPHTSSTLPETDT